jgi:hypothetical protein
MKAIQLEFVGGAKDPVTQPVWLALAGNICIVSRTLGGPLKSSDE